MSLIEPLLRLTRIDFRPTRRPPSALLTLLSVIVGVVLSVLINMLIVRVAVTLDPSLAGFPHFQLADYGRLTIIGALIACIGWPILVRVSSAPLLVYVVLAVLGTLVLWLPDLYVLAVLHEPAHAVLGLAVMHVAVPVVSCGSMVLIARSAPMRVRGAQVHIP